jgi:hypothetical protein
VLAWIYGFSPAISNDCWKLDRKGLKSNKKRSKKKKKIIWI